MSTWCNIAVRCTIWGERDARNDRKCAQSGQWANGCKYPSGLDWKSCKDCTFFWQGLHGRLGQFNWRRSLGRPRGCSGKAVCLEEVEVFTRWWRATTTWSCWSASWERRKARRATSPRDKSRRRRVIENASDVQQGFSGSSSSQNRGGRKTSCAIYQGSLWLVHNLKRWTLVGQCRVGVCCVPSM